MKIKNLLAVAALAALSNLASAAGDDAATQAATGVAQGVGAGAAQAATKDVALQAVAAKFRAMYPNTTFTDIRASGIDGLYELVMGQNVAYTDASGRYFVFGHLFDMKEQVDLTAQRQQEQQAARRVEYPKGLLGNAIKTVKGDGSRQLAVFADPNCGYCKKLEQELTKVENVTIYTFLYPVLGEDSKTLAIATWCAADRSKAWSDWMLNQKRPALVSCVTPINDNTVLGSRLGVTGTPTLIAADGRILPGAAPADKINEWLGGAK
jgi:thiol:disulfide interchange protein DsbC